MCQRHNICTRTAVVAEASGAPFRSNHAVAALQAAGRKEPEVLSTSTNFFVLAELSRKGKSNLLREVTSSLFWFTVSVTRLSSSLPCLLFSECPLATSPWTSLTCLALNTGCTKKTTWPRKYKRRPDTACNGTCTRPAALLSNYMYIKSVAYSLCILWRSKS